MVLNDGIAPSLLQRSLGTSISYDAQGSVPTSATFDSSISRASDAFTGSTRSETEAYVTGDIWEIGSGIGFETGPSTYASGS